MNESINERYEQAQQHKNVVLAKIHYHTDELEKQVDLFCDLVVEIETYEKMLKEQSE